MKAPKDPEDKKILFNCYLPRPVIARLKEVVRRRCVQKMRRVSEATMVEVALRKLRMPPEPSPEKAEEYYKQLEAKAALAAARRKK